MNPVESIFYMIWRGLAVGVLISAPMGPVGMLCIQRTLDKGRKAGFYTGIGAAISDLFYCLLTGFGLSFIEDFLQENQNVIQLLGSIVLIGFSIYLFRKNPSSSLRRPVPQNVSAKKNILGGFLFTFSNPLIIFLIIGLFARFNFTAPEIEGGFYAVGYVFIIIGALAWWYGVTHLVERVRARFNMRSMKKLNVTIGLVILAFACVGIVSSIIGLTSADARGAGVRMPFYAVHPLSPQSVAGNADPRYERSVRLEGRTWEGSRISLFDAASDSVAADCDRDSITGFRLDFRLADNASHPGKKYCFTDSSGVRQTVKMPPWSLVVADADGREATIGFRHGEYSPTPLSSQTALFVALAAPSGDVMERPIADGIAMAGGLNHFRLIYDAGRLRLMAGNRRLGQPVDFGDAATGLGEVRRIVLQASPGADVTLVNPILRLPYSPSARRSVLTQEEVEYRLANSADPTEGRWRVLDHTLDESSLKLGGEYTLAVVRRPDGTYEIIYESGATVNPRAWSPGMIKGEMRPTGIEGVYDLEWRDSGGMPIRVQAKAQRESADILTLHFPRLGSTVRFQRL